EPLPDVEMNDTQDEEDDEVDGADALGSLLPGDVAKSSPHMHDDPLPTSIFDDEIPCSQPESPEVNMTLGDEKMMTSDEGGVIDKHAIVMISDDDTTPKKSVISEPMDPEAATIASYQEKLKQLKAQLALTKKKNCAERARNSLDQAQEVPIPVIESLGFGGDNQETLQLAPGELDDLAKDFQSFQLDGEKMDDISPVLRRAQLALKSADDGDDGKGVPDDSAPSDPPGLENPDKSKGPENLDMVGESEKVVEPEKEDKPPAKPNSKKRQAAGGHKVAGGSGGSQPDEVKPKKRKANPENAEPAPKKAAAKKKTCETSDADQTAKKAKTQPATFARRAQPTTSFGKARWLALRDVFNNRIRAFVKAPSKHEDIFWKFAGDWWAKKQYEMDESNLPMLSSEAATEYLAKLERDDSIADLGHSRYGGLFCARATTTYPPRFGQRIARLYKRFCTKRVALPEASIADQDTQPATPEELKQARSKAKAKPKPAAAKSKPRANKRMQEQMDVLMAGGKGKSASAFQTPPPTVNGPTPKSKSKETEVPKGASGVKVDLKKRLDPNEVARTQGKDPPDLFVSRVTKTITKTNKLTRKKKRGWFTKETMNTVLKWSSTYIKSVVAYCEKPGNERLVKKDRYNKKIHKYYVVYGEEDDELSEDEEKNETRDHEVGEDVTFKRLGAVTEGSESEEDLDEDEKKAEQINTAKKEYLKFCTFTASLLKRGEKLADLIGMLEAAVGDKEPEKARVAKSVSNLEAAISTLETEFEACEVVKVDTSALQSGKCADETVCSKVTTAELAAKTNTGDESGYMEYFSRDLITGDSGEASARVKGPARSSKMDLAKLADDFDASTFDWETVRPFGLLSHCVRTGAPSKHIVELAQAEVRNNPRATLGMRKLAAIRLKDAEKGVHKLLKEEGFECTVPVGKFTVRPGFTIPYILLSSWVKYLLDCGRLPKLLVGVPTFAKMRLVLKEWWARFRVLYPDHGYFGHAERHGIPFENLVPFFSHADDGRSYKHLGIWILSSAGCIGRGTRMHVDSNRHRLPLHENAMGANFMGKTWTTQFIFTTVLKTVYTQYPNILDELTSIYAEDVKKLLFEGVLAANGRDRVYLAHMGFKADLPMLQKMGGFHRCWSHVPRQSSSRKPSEGCCHLCLGGREGNPSFPYEDFRPDAAWTATIYMEVPWAPDCPPKIFEGLPLSPTDQMDFFKSDFWHNWHLGMSKHFLASALVAIVESDLEILPRGSVEKRFEFLTEMYVKFHRDRNVTPFLAEISRDSMSFPASTAAPAGATKAINIAITFMYQAGFWIRAADAMRLSGFLYFFLAKYTVCARLTLQLRLRRFAMLPKGHMISHEAKRLMTESKKGAWVVNTIVFTNQ
ncbi:unnamed protein product, partial [Cladocopium goreaui]